MPMSGVDQSGTDNEVNCILFPGCYDGRGAEEGAGHQLSPGEDEEEPGGHREGPAAPSGRG